MNCTRCGGTGFLNIEQCRLQNLDDVENVMQWIKENPDTDVSVCDCCGDGKYWHGEPGQHYGINDPQGRDGPYSYNGGLCECH